MCKFCLYKHVSFETLPKLRHPIFQITTEKISPQTSAMKPIFSKIRSKNKFSQRTQLKNQASGRVHKSPQNLLQFFKRRKLKVKNLASHSQIFTFGLLEIFFTSTQGITRTNGASSEFISSSQFLNFFEAAPRKSRTIQEELHNYFQSNIRI